MAHILIVEDDVLLAEMIADWIAHDSHTAELVQDGEEAIRRLHFGNFDLVLLDWQLPGDCSGFDVLTQVRARGIGIPIIMLTGKDSVTDKEKGLDGGAFDYMTKPFHMRELTARLRVALRSSVGSATNVIRAADLELDPKKHKVTKAGVLIELRRTEFALLEFLMRHPGQLFSAASLLERVWGTESESTPEAIHSCIRRIRKKIETSETPLIVAVRGEGYKFGSK